MQRMSVDKTKQGTRQELYKYYSRSPCWKERFRKRCLERLKESRSQHQLSKRLNTSLHESDLNAFYDKKPWERIVGQTDAQKSNSGIEIIMREEFNRLKGEVTEERSSSAVCQERDSICDVVNHQESCSLVKSVGQEGHSLHSARSRQDGWSLSDVHEDNCLNVHALDSWYEEMYETLKKELEEAQKKEEEQCLQSVQRACDEHIKQEEEICSGLQALCTDEIICPLCEKFNLIEHRNVILCRCGLKIDIEQDSINLKYMKESLAAGTEEHSQKCEFKPSFSLIEKFGISNLLMSCQECDFLFVIV